jgi:hypothetical protein
MLSNYCSSVLHPVDTDVQYNNILSVVDVLITSPYCSTKMPDDEDKRHTYKSILLLSSLFLTFFEIKVLQLHCKLQGCCASIVSAAGPFTSKKKKKVLQNAHFMFDIFQTFT